MANLRTRVMVSQGDDASPFPATAPGVAGIGALAYPLRGVISVKSAGTVDASSPPVAPEGPFVSTSRTSAGIYLINLTPETDPASDILLAPMVSIRTSASGFLATANAFMVSATQIRVNVLDATGTPVDANFHVALFVLEPAA